MTEMENNIPHQIPFVRFYEGKLDLFLKWLQDPFSVVEFMESNARNNLSACPKAKKEFERKKYRGKEISDNACHVSDREGMSQTLQNNDF